MVSDFEIHEKSVGKMSILLFTGSPTLGTRSKSYHQAPPQSGICSRLTKTLGKRVGVMCEEKHLLPNPTKNKVSLEALSRY